jgi:hypothetical protein
MGLSRTALLWCSQNQWMKTNVPKYTFVKKAVKKFMPGESVDDAVAAALEFKSRKALEPFLLDLVRTFPILMKPHL